MYRRGTLVTTVLAALAIALLATDSAQARRGGGGRNRTRLEARLTGQTLASGKAKFERRSDRIRFSAEVEDIAPGTVISVWATRGGVSKQLGTTVADAAGIADLNLDSRDGDNVPVMQEGDEISVLVNGQLLVSGFLRAK